MFNISNYNRYLALCVYLYNTLVTNRKAMLQLHPVTVTVLVPCFLCSKIVRK